MNKAFRLTRALQITGWMSEAELAFLAEMASTHKIIFEIGSYQGRSTRAMADNLNDDSVIYAIDSWDYYITTLVKSDFITYNQFIVNLYEHIQASRVVPRHISWQNFWVKQTPDFIFIDGDHVYNSVSYDINKALKCLKPGGIIAGHDYAPEFPGVVKAVHEIFDKFNLVESIWWTQKS